MKGGDAGVAFFCVIFCAREHPPPPPTTRERGEVFVPGSTFFARPRKLPLSTFPPAPLFRRWPMRKIAGGRNFFFYRDVRNPNNPPRWWPENRKSPWPGFAGQIGPSCGPVPAVPPPREVPSTFRLRQLPAWARRFGAGPLAPPRGFEKYHRHWNRPSAGKKGCPLGPPAPPPCEKRWPPPHAIRIFRTPPTQISFPVHPGLPPFADSDVSIRRFPPPPVFCSGPSGGGKFRGINMCRKNRPRPRPFCPSL